MTVRFFAAARERTRCSSEVLELAEGARVEAALEVLRTKYPGLVALMPHLRVALNQEFASPDAPLIDGSELALIPPVAGGSGGLFRIQAEPLRLDEVVGAVTSVARGGVVTFTGVVRQVSHGKHIVQLTYEAYGPMAEKVLARIAEEARARWPGVELAVVHRVGELVPGDLAVVIAAAAPHRKEAFLACEYTIDRLKEDVPIWKKERTIEGEEWVGLGP